MKRLDEHRECLRAVQEIPVLDSEEQDILAGRRILVAEDNAINAEIICGLLDMFGAESVVVKDGKQAVEEFSGTAPGTYDAVLMDIQATDERI